MVDLPSVTFECETVTPLFLGGAEPRGEPELRAPSLRGGMRYWFRALAGETDVGRLRARESAIFGGTGEQATASQVMIRLLGGSFVGESWDDVAAGVPRMHQLPLRYLAFPFRAKKDENGRVKVPSRKCIPAGTRFRLVFAASGTRGATKGQEIPPSVLASLWATVYIGGLGARARRGFGSLLVRSVSSAPPLEAPALSSELRTAEDVADFYRRSIDAALRACSPPGGSRPLATVPSHPTLSPEWSRVLVVKREDWRTWQDALAAVGKHLSDVRRGLRLDARAALGLPIQGVEATISRRSSPLTVRLIARQHGVTVVLAAFRTQPLPASDTVTARGVRFEPGNADAIIADVLTSLITGLGGGLEAHGRAFR